jgi:hypothetical protein
MRSRASSFITHSTVRSNHHTRNDKEGCPDESMKKEETEDRLLFEDGGWKTEHIDPVAVQIARYGFEHEPAKYQWKGDQGCDDTAPHDQPNGLATGFSSQPDEMIQREICGNSLETS